MSCYCTSVIPVGYGEGLIIEVAVTSLPCANSKTYKGDAYLLLHMRNYTH